LPVWLKKKEAANRSKRAIRFQREGTMTRGLFLLIFVMAAATTFFSGAPSASADTTCDARYPNTRDNTYSVTNRIFIAQPYQNGLEQSESAGGNLGKHRRTVTRRNLRAVERWFRWPYLVSSTVALTQTGEYQSLRRLQLV
jgi:hypothetical protein